MNASRFAKLIPSWPEWFQREAARLRSALPGDLVPEIRHIGSTAVPGLDAKPIVDLMVGIVEPGRIAEVVERLERLGYESLGEAGVPGRWALRKRDVAQPSNIAIVAYEGEWWKLNLAVRDYLRANAESSPGLRLGEMACRQRWRGYVARLLRRQARHDRKDRRGGALLLVPDRPRCPKSPRRRFRHPLTGAHTARTQECIGNPSGYVSLLDSPFG